jgi:hypothetical protein
MSLMDAPAYDPTSDNRRRNFLIGILVAVVLFVIITFAGYMLGHGWLFSNLSYEHRVSTFFDALEAKDYTKAYAIYYNDPDWQQHPAKYSSYPLARFTDDWTKDSPINAPITSHQVDKSVVSGSGRFGSGVIVAVRLNGDHKIFVYVNRKTKKITWPAPYVFQYNL